jgi:hypothetical protein
MLIVHHYISCSDTDQPTWRDRPLAVDGNAAEKSLSQVWSPPVADVVILYCQECRVKSVQMFVATHDDVESLAAQHDAVLEGV